MAKEKSPYLLQHAHNPVDWYPWGAEAFERAKKENKPIFLSIGYSTCHWCHVMERESFENEEVARLINQWFVAVKVDREERPDVDHVYMTFVQATTGSGGWPMTVFLTPDLKPIAGGTYFPPKDKDGLPGLKTVLPRLHEAWENQHDKVVEQAETITKALQEYAAPDAAGAFPPDAVAKAVARLAKEYDKAHGGFALAPKFPEPVNLRFLLHYASKTPGDEGNAAREQVLHTLRAMAAGGIHDQIGGGFHRYSTDERWFLPHFEKMLYDQAQLVDAYLDAYQLTGDAFFASVARDVLEYVLRDMTGPAGEFFSAEDADSAPDATKPGEKREGAFYVWRAEEINTVLGTDGPAFAKHFGVNEKGNVERDPRNEFVGQNVLAGVVSGDFQVAKERLRAARERRPRPHRDDKALAGWNGLMISTMVRAGRALDEPRFFAAGIHGAEFLRDHLYDARTRTLHRYWRNGAAAEGAGFLEDYALATRAALDVYQTSLRIEWLKLALELQARQDELFWDDKAGGYFSDAGSDKTVLMRMKGETDGVLPSGNSVTAMNLLRLAQLRDDRPLRERAARTINAMTEAVKRNPAAMPALMEAWEFSRSKPKQIVVVGKPDEAALQKLMREAWRRYLPESVILLADEAEGQTYLAERIEFLKDVKRIDGKPTAYVCENYACQLPVNSPAALGRLLDGKPLKNSP